MAPRKSAIRHCGTISCDIFDAPWQCDGNVLRQMFDLHAQDVGAIGFIQHFGAGQTALHMACATGALPLVVALLKAGADPNLRDRTGASCVAMASSAGHAHVLQKFPGLGRLTGDQLPIMSYTNIKIGRMHSIGLSDFITFQSVKNLMSHPTHSLLRHSCRHP